MKCFALFALSAKGYMCTSASLLIWVGVNCLRVVSRVKDLKQWASVFSATSRWLQKPLYKEWLREIKGDKHRARCIVCMKDVDISNMGESALTSHLKGKKHQRLTSQKRSLASVPEFFLGFFSRTSNYKWWCQTSFKIRFIWKWRTQRA